CGDALMPDALAALEQLGLKHPVFCASRASSAVHVHAPNGASVCAPVDLRCLPRERFDSLLREAAVAAGAMFAAPYELSQALEDAGSVIGARFTGRQNGE